MFNDTNTLLSIIAVGILTGIAVWGVLYGLIVQFGGPQARVRSRVRQFVKYEGVARLDQAEAREAQRETLFTELDSRWQDRTLFRALKDDIDGADLHITPTELVLIQVGIGVGLAIVLWYLVPVVGFLLIPVGFVVGLVGVRSYVRYLARRRIQRFEQQLPNNLSILSGSVRGGFSLFQAMQLMSKEAPEPSKTEFTRVIQEIALGNNLSTALSGLAKRIPTEDIDILTTAITMQQQTGGNLTHVLEVVASTIRERHRVEGEIRALTAQQRFSAILLAALPFMLGAVLFLISPTYMGQMFQPGWVLCMPIGAITMSIVGFFAMRKLANIDV